MHQFPIGFKALLVLFSLAWTSETSPTDERKVASAEYVTVPVVGPCATVRCGFNTTCFEFNGMAACYNTTCSPGEIFVECSSYCEPTCTPTNIACIQSCGPPACQCQPGFVRDNGMCIDPSLCSNIKPTTPSNEQRARCADVRVKCAAGHHCEDTPTGITCAPDPVCPPNEEFNICASDCEQTCVPMGRPCTMNCLPPKCQCKSGFVREGGQCIDHSDCPDVGEITTTTQNYADEPVTPTLTTCDQLIVRLVCADGFHCEIVNGEQGCVPDPVTPPLTTCDQALIRILCITGYHCEIVNGAPACVPDKACGANEEFTQCPSCEPTCGPIVPCLPGCFPPACRCVNGYVRDNGVCIRSTDCKTSYG
ncbi:hypothetical protein V3C99_015830 [Haemonchus contortus]